VRIFDCTKAPGRAITRDGSRGAEYAGLVSIQGQAAQGLIRLAAGGRLGRHPAPMRQLALVLSGSGRVSGADGDAVDLGPGKAVLWEPGEEHEATTETGMTLLILEAEQLEMTEPADER
jgi:quercetin dioxygenase-like cupin family protein